ncbi:MAG: hypothetical protein Mars2KO_05010 [Maribacter sp.]
MVKGLQEHIDEIREFQRRHQNLFKDYGKNKKNNKRINREMTDIRDVCQRHIFKNNLNEYLVHGGVTPQVKSEYNDFNSASDFYEILENLISQLKSN